MSAFLDAVVGIARAATAHNYGPTIREATVTAGCVDVRMSSWPRCREAQQALEAAGYDAVIPDEANIVRVRPTSSTGSEQ